MRAAYECFKTGADPEAIRQVGATQGGSVRLLGPPGGQHAGRPAAGVATARALANKHQCSLPYCSWVQAARGDRQGHDAFYSLLYVGLWQEAHGHEEEARAAITQVRAVLLWAGVGCSRGASVAQHTQRWPTACQHSGACCRHMAITLPPPLTPLYETRLQAASTEYALGSGDYMAALARVHCLRRGW